MKNNILSDLYPQLILYTRISYTEKVYYPAKY